MVDVDEIDKMDQTLERFDGFPVKSCDRFQFLEMDFVPIAVADPDEHIFVSDTEEYLVTKSETAWLLQSIVDNELIMFGLSGTRFFDSRALIAPRYCPDCFRRRDEYFSRETLQRCLSK